MGIGDGRCSWAVGSCWPVDHKPASARFHEADGAAHVRPVRAAFDFTILPSKMSERVPGRETRSGDPMPKGLDTLPGDHLHSPICSATCCGILGYRAETTLAIYLAAASACSRIVRKYGNWYVSMKASTRSNGYTSNSPPLRR